jgi:hypothetical protein
VAEPQHWPDADHDRKDPAVGALQAGLRTPTALYSPPYGKPDKTQAHRTHETVQGLAVLGRARHSAGSRSADRTGVLLKTYRSMRNGFAVKDHEGVRRSGRMDKGRQVADVPQVVR